MRMHAPETGRSSFRRAYAHPGCSCSGFWRACIPPPHTQRRSHFPFIGLTYKIDTLLLLLWLSATVGVVIPHPWKRQECGGLSREEACWLMYKKLRWSNVDNVKGLKFSRILPPPPLWSKLWTWCGAVNYGPLPFFFFDSFLALRTSPHLEGPPHPEGKSPSPSQKLLPRPADGRRNR